MDIPEFSFGELDDLQVCLIFPFECLWEWKRKMMNKQLGKNSGFNYPYIHIFSCQHMMHCMPNIPFGQQFIFTFYILFIYLFLISIFYHKQTIDWYKFLKYEKSFQKYEGWFKPKKEKKKKKKRRGNIPNKICKIAIQIKDETRTWTKYRNSVQLKGVKIPSQKKPFAWLHFLLINLQYD